jgi:histidine phosphotransferase ChpT
VFAHVRAELDWGVTQVSLPKAPAQVVLNLAQLAGAALPVGGVARLDVSQDRDGYRVTAFSKGPKARLHAEVATGFAGEPLGDGLGGRWVQAYYLHALAAAAGGALHAETGEETVTFIARLPA